MIDTPCLPHSLDTEEVVIGSIILDHRAFGKVVGVLHPEVFYLARHSRIFAAAERIHAKKGLIDITTMVVELKSSGDLEPCGGAYGVSVLMNKVATADNIEYHAKILLQFFVKRKLIELSDIAGKRAADEYTDVFDALDLSNKEIKGLYQYLAHNKVVGSNDVFDQAVADSRKASLNDGVSGYPSGFKTMDLYLNGFKPGNKYTFAARPSMGKTTIVKNICKHLALNTKLPGVFFSMEMTAKQLMATVIAELTQIDSMRIEQGRLTEPEWAMVEAIKSKYPLENLIIDPTSGISPEYIEAQVKRWKEERNIGWFAYDYVQLCRIRGMEKQKEAMISYITSSTKGIAKQTETICFEISQLSRDVERRTPSGKLPRPILSDLRDSGSIEQDADVVVFLVRPEYYGFKTLGKQSSAGVCEIDIAKNRQGPLKRFAMDTSLKTYTFKDRDRYEIDEGDDNNQQPTDIPKF